jgi:hypothetical protein
LAARADVQPQADQVNRVQRQGHPGAMSLPK